MNESPASIGSGLRRPESVLATAAGDLYVSDSRGGVTRIRPDGAQDLYVGHSADVGEQLAPNGIALEADGSFLIAHLGAAYGGVFGLGREGALRPVLRSVDGIDLPPTNFVTRDRTGRLWVTVSTRVVPRDRDYRRDAHGGFVVVDDGRGPRIATEGLGFTNECAVSPDGFWLYVNETFTRRLSRFPIGADAGLGSKEVVAQFGAGQFPDGMAFAADGSVWIACVVVNQVLRVDPTGRVEVWLDAGAPEPVAAVEDAWRSGAVTPAQLAHAGAGSLLGNCSCVAFAGPHRRRLVLGSLGNDHLSALDAPVSGAELVHWRY